MSIEISYTQARDNLANYMDRAAEDHEVVKIRRKITGGGIQEVALIDADDLESLLETAYLLRSPKNAERLFSALTRSLSQSVNPGSIGDLERQFGLSLDLEPARIPVETPVEASEDNSPDTADSSKIKLLDL
jgi:antitoxin YefM